jgi:D-glycero-alpha-D-manno-heptose 1-phosphate guanylyltransferase
MKAVLLVGGLGTRLRSVVPSTPKPLAAVGGKSFLQLLVQQLRSQGIHHLVMCTGYLGDQVQKEFGDGRLWDAVIEYSQEETPLGTAGAVKLAQRYLQHEREFLVMNGDSFVEINFDQLIQFHRGHNGLASMAVLETENAARYGTVRTEAHGRVSGFLEKTGLESPGLVNAGVYVFDRAVLEFIPDGPASLERDVFPRILEHGLYAQKQQGMFIDIGTPQDYALAQQLYRRLSESACQKQETISKDRQCENQMI